MTSAQPATRSPAHVLSLGGSPGATGPNCNGKHVAPGPYQGPLA